MKILELITNIVIYTIVRIIRIIIIILFFPILWVLYGLIIYLRAIILDEKFDINIISKD
jgi:hypothetical protein